MDNNGKLFERVGAVTARLAGKLAPDKTNQQQRYDYLSADLILQEVGRAMADVGLAIVSAVVGEEMASVPWKNGERYDAAVRFEMHVCDVDGNVFSVPWLGRGSDYSVPDKAVYKAVTSGHKYFLMKLFNIGAGNDDGEHEVQPPQGAPRQNRQAPHTQRVNPSPNGSGAQPEPEPEPVSSAPLPDDELVAFEASAREFFDTCAALIDRYDNVHAVKAAFKKLGFDRIPGNAADRLNMYRALKAHAAERDSEEQAPLFDDAGNGAYAE